MAHEVHPGAEHYDGLLNEIDKLVDDRQLEKALDRIEKLDVHQLNPKQYLRRWSLLDRIEDVNREGAAA